MLHAHLQELARSSVLCWLATVGQDGMPSVSPKEVWAVLDDTHIVIAHIASPCSAANVAVQPQVCVSFVDVFRQKGYKVQGLARVVLPSDPDFQRWAAPLQALVQGRFPLHGVFVVAAEHVQPIVAPSYALYPQETSEESQIEAALRTYRVARINAAGAS